MLLKAILKIAKLRNWQNICQKLAIPANERAFYGDIDVGEKSIFNRTNETRAIE